MDALPDELKREIVKFIPRHDTAQMIHDSRYTLSLNYVRRFNYEDNLLYSQRIWEELKPINLKSVFYGDTHKITRSNISLGQYIQLRYRGIL